MNPDLLSPQPQACATTMFTLASPPSVKGAFAAVPPGNVLGWGAVCLRNYVNLREGSAVLPLGTSTCPQAARHRRVWMCLRVIFVILILQVFGCSPGWTEGMFLQHQARPKAATLAQGNTMPLWWFYRLCMQLSLPPWFLHWHAWSSHSFAWDKNKSTLRANKQSRACKTWAWSDHSLLLLSWLGFGSWRQD